MTGGELIRGPPSRIATVQHAQLVVNVTTQKRARPLFRRTGEEILTIFLSCSKWAACSPGTMQNSFLSGPLGGRGRFPQPAGEPAGHLGEEVGVDRAAQ